jgi:hypothetical protein
LGLLLLRRLNSSSVGVEEGREQPGPEARGGRRRWRNDGGEGQRRQRRGERDLLLLLLLLLLLRCLCHASSQHDGRLGLLGRRPRGLVLRRGRQEGEDGRLRFGACGAGGGSGGARPSAIAGCVRATAAPPPDVVFVAAIARTALLHLLMRACCLLGSRLGF